MIQVVFRMIRILVLSTILLCSLAGVVYADPATNRLAGQDRYQTAAVIAKDGWQQSDYAILAYGENYPDALAAAPLAYKYNAPILLTDTNTLTPQTQQALQDLKVKNVFIVGGSGVVSDTVSSQLKAMNITPERISGTSRYDTSVALANKLGSNVNQVFVATGDNYADALSAASIAGKLGMPILLVQKDTLPDSVNNYLASHNITKSYVLGGTGVVSDSVMSQLPNPQRLSGNSRYDTNIAILNQFSSSFNTNSVAMATGEGYADALTGSAYAAKNNMPVVLLPSDYSQSTLDYVSKKAPNFSNVTVFGGESVVQTQNVKNHLNGVSPSPTTPSSTTLKSEADLAGNIDIQSNLLKKYYDSGALSSMILKNLANRLVDIENQLNNPAFVYGDTLISAVKRADDNLTAVDINNQNVAKGTDADTAYQTTRNVLDRVKSKMHINYTPSTNTGSTNNGSTNPTDSTPTTGGTTVYAKEATPSGLHVSMTPSPGYTPIVVQFGAHSYGVGSQSQYNAVMKAAQATKAKWDATIRDTPDYQDVMAVKNGTADARTERYTRDVYSSDILNLSEPELVRFLSASIASVNINEYDGLKNGGDGPTAYDAIYNNDGSCLGIAFSGQAVFDLYGYNTRVVGEADHAWIQVNVNGVWHNFGGAGNSSILVSHETISNQP